MQPSDNSRTPQPKKQAWPTRRQKALALVAVAVGAWVVLLAGGSGRPALEAAGAADPSAREVAFRKHVIHPEFVSEGVAVGDVNRDGKTDILAGAFWFEAPHWKKHELAPPQAFAYDKGYSNAFVSQALDVNLDGWVDFIRIGFPGKEAVWYENPQGKAGHWKMHLIHAAVGNESAGFWDVDGDGRLDLLCGDSEKEQMMWLQAPLTKGATEWTKYPISQEKAPGTQRFSHGLGLGDLNGDGRKDVIVKDGWWEAPKDPRQPNWRFHQADFGEDCAQMHAYDFDGDGDPDVVSSSAHDYGMWWHEQRKDEQGKTHWKRHLISKDFSQTHSLSLVDVNRDGHPDLVTGKRYFAHNGSDPGEFEPAVLYWFELKPGKKPQWVPHQIDDDSGVGVHVVTEDVTKNGLVDVVVGNKKGVFFFEQEGGGKKAAQ